MSSFLFPLAPPSLPILGEARRFPVGRVFCVGRNYAAHAAEMGQQERAPPFFFMKPAASVVAEGGVIAYPPDTADLHHEVELVAALYDGGANIAPSAAMALVYGCAVGIDFTKRDRQAALKDKGHPWERAKAFEGSAPVGALTPGARPIAGGLRLLVNGAVRQDGRLEDMIWPLPDIIAHLSAIWTLRPGDLIFTGTPAGVGPVNRGDRLEAAVDGLTPLSVTLS